MFDTGGMAGQLSRATALITEATTAITPEITGPQAGEALREAIAAEQQLTLTICLLTERVARTGEYPPTVPCRWLPGYAPKRPAPGRAGACCPCRAG